MHGRQQASPALSPFVLLRGGLPRTLSIAYSLKTASPLMLALQILTLHATLVPRWDRASGSVHCNQGTSSCVGTEKSRLYMCAYQGEQPTVVCLEGSSGARTRVPRALMARLCREPLLDETSAQPPLPCMDARFVRCFGKDSQANRPKAKSEM